MVKESVYTIQALNKEIKAVVVFTDNGINATVAGGDKSHIGAVSIADEEGKITTTVFPNHKEAVISEYWAEKLFDRYRVPVVASAGIHFDNISRDGINEVITACKELVRQI